MYFVMILFFASAAFAAYKYVKRKEITIYSILLLLFVLSSAPVVYQKTDFPVLFMLSGVLFIGYSLFLSYRLGEELDASGGKWVLLTFFFHIPAWILIGLYVKQNYSSIYSRLTANKQFEIFNKIPAIKSDYDIRTNEFLNKEKESNIRDSLFSGSGTKFLTTERKGENGEFIWDIYSSSNRKTAIKFLKDNTLKGNNHFIEVRFPEGSLSKDSYSIYDTATRKNLKSFEINPITSVDEELYDILKTLSRTFEHVKQRIENGSTPERVAAEYPDKKTQNIVLGGARYLEYTLSKRNG